MRMITILAHTGIVVGVAGVFFGLLAWAHHSPYGVTMAAGSGVLFLFGGVLGWYYGFSPMWQPRGWEDQVEYAGQVFVVSTQPYPPYLAYKARRADGAKFGSAIYALAGEEVADDAHALYGMQWRVRRDAEEGHRWIVHTIGEGKMGELEDFRARPE